MSESQHKDFILETIDSLRKRKARPDLERICHMVERRHYITFSETEADLEKLVEAGIVIKVDYKGSTSYRNAAKWRKSQLGGSVLNSNDASRRVLAAVRELLSAAHSADGPSGPAGGERRGVTFSDIEKHLHDDEDTPPAVAGNISALVHMEVEAGRLKLLSSGNYVLGAVKPKPKSPKSPKTGGGATGDQARHASGGSSSPTKKGRPPGVKRKIKDGKKSPKDHKEAKIKRPNSHVNSDGPTPTNSQECENSTESTNHREESMANDVTTDISDTEKELSMASPSTSGSSSTSLVVQPTPTQPPRTPTTPVGIAPRAVVGAGGEGMIFIESKCDYCLLTSECNRVGQPEELLYCKDCQAKAHPSCMDYSEDLAKRARNSPWQCIDCKTCYVCEDSGDPDAMLFCDACDKGYHMNCHNPQVLEKPTGKWVCSKCILELGHSNGDLLDQSNEQDDVQENSSSASDNNNTSSVNKNAEGGGASCLPTPSDSPVYFSELHNGREEHTEVKDQRRPSLTMKISNRHTMPSLPRLSETLPAIVPDASEWSIEDVVQFFRNVGFVDQAEVFREQEIDGRSLLLMRRSDVLQGLSLKLGPALKIYTHVQRLQMRCDSTL